MTTRSELAAHGRCSISRGTYGWSTTYSAPRSYSDIFAGGLHRLTATRSAQTLSRCWPRGHVLAKQQEKERAIGERISITPISTLDLSGLILLEETGAAGGTADTL